jgi:hypothetical protein
MFKPLADVASIHFSQQRFIESNHQNFHFLDQIRKSFSWSTFENKAGSYLKSSNINKFTSCLRSKNFYGALKPFYVSSRSFFALNKYFKKNSHFQGNATLSTTKRNRRRFSEIFSYFSKLVQNSFRKPQFFFFFL